MNAPRSTLLFDLSTLALRVVFGGLMLFEHGLGKLERLGADPVSFPDPLGIGTRTSLLLAIGAEVGCAALLVVGCASRLALAPLIFTMVIAAVVVHGGDPIGERELAIVYLTAFIAMFGLGPGRFSLSTLWRRRLEGRPLLGFALR